MVSEKMFLMLVVVLFDEKERFNPKNVTKGRRDQGR